MVESCSCVDDATPAPTPASLSSFSTPPACIERESAPAAWIQAWGKTSGQTEDSLGAFRRARKGKNESSVADASHRA
jgi:hypothetical protein